MGLARAALLVAHQPLLGYGDQSDMHRSADCFGLQPLAAATAPGEFVRPHRGYRMAGVKRAGCYPSSAVVLAAPVVTAYGIASIAGGDSPLVIPMNAFGLFHLLLFALLALAIALALAPHPVASVVHAALFFLLIADPVATLWLNTFYTEPAALLGAYGAVAMSAVIVLEGGTKRWHWWLLAAALVSLGLAREQFGYLPLALAALAAPALMRRSRRGTGIVLAVALVVAAAQVALAPLRPGYISPINRVNAYLGVILAASRDEPATLARLGLPARCGAMSGATWWLRRGENLEAVCPEVVGLSSIAFMRLIPTEPFTLLRAVSRVLPAAQSVVPGYLGIAAEGPIRAVPDLPPRVMSFVALLSWTPSMVFAAIVMALLISFPVAVAWLVWTARNEAELSAVPLTYALLVAIAGYALATTALGDGIAGAERHNWPGAMATLAAVLFLPLVAWQLARDLLRARIALAAAFGVVLLAAGWVLWTRHQPLAIGVVDRVAEGTPRTLEVRGWALDPWGVRRVFATVGGGPRSEGTRAMVRNHALEAIYPGYPEAISGEFRISIASNAWREHELMRIYVESRAGALTEIDRRVIRLRP